MNWVRWAVAAGLLAWGALPYLPGQIDDAFIVFAYAHRILDQGEIAWNTGERVEGYSSPFHLLLMVVAAAQGLDLAVFSRVVSWLCSLVVIGLFLRPMMGPGRWWIALAVAAWQPFQFWSVAGLETALGGLIAVAAWPLVLGSRLQWAYGTVLCVLFSLTRPEGAAWLAIALLRRVALPRALGRPEALVGAALAALVAYHAGRIWYFQALLPTPYLVKIVAVDGWSIGLDQLGRELLSAAAIGAALLAWRRRLDAWILAPLLIQGALLVRAGGDWMGHGRFLLPGVLAVAAAGMSRPADGVRISILVASLPALLVGFAWEPTRLIGREAGLRDGWYLRHPLAALRAPWPTPMLEETSFLVERIPRGAGAYISDVGLPGNLHDVRVWDGAGLTDRLVAELIAGQHAGLPPAMQARYDDDDDIWCIRYNLGPGGEDTADAWLKEKLPETLPSRASAAGIWRCRPGAAPDVEVVLERWRKLSERFPSQDWIRWYYARALLSSGRLADASRAASGARWLGRDGDGWIAFGAGQSGEYVPGRGWALYGNGRQTSVAAPYGFWRKHTLVLDVDDPGEPGAQARIAWDDGCAEPTEVWVRERAVIEPPSCDRDGDRSLIVEFVNDEAWEGFDRNLYVSLAESKLTSGQE